MAEADLVEIDNELELSIAKSGDRMMRYFRFKHLPPDLAGVSSWFAQTAIKIASQTSSPERTVALRKLLEAKDCAVRNALDSRT